MIEASAPIRICDNGGWTDTWFGGPGRVLNIAVTPGVEVSVRKTTGPDPVVLVVESFGDRYPVVPGASRVARHSLLGEAKLIGAGAVHIEAQFGRVHDLVQVHVHRAGDARRTTNWMPGRSPTW